MTPCISFTILIGVALISFLFTVRTVIELTPSLLATAIRWKESLNLEASVKLSRDRNLIALNSTVPFCLTAFAFNLYNPAFLNQFTPDAQLWICIGVFCSFVAIRSALEHILKPRRIQAKGYKAIVSVGYSFFIILTMLLLLIVCISYIFGISGEHAKSAMLWISGLTYLLYLIRKLQIFNSFSSFFAGFLYLCALEILPTGVLVTSAVIF
jgi:hypothetical protein